jgi:hypothetical protein
MNVKMVEVDDEKGKTKRLLLVGDERQSRERIGEGERSAFQEGHTGMEKVTLAREKGEEASANKGK